MANTILGSGATAARLHNDAQKASAGEQPESALVSIKNSVLAEADFVEGIVEYLRMIADRTFGQTVKQTGSNGASVPPGVSALDGVSSALDRLRRATSTLREEALRFERI